MKQPLNFDTEDYLNKVIKKNLPSEKDLKVDIKKVIGNITSWIFLHPKITKATIAIILIESIVGIIQTIKLFI